MHDDAIPAPSAHAPKRGERSVSGKAIVIPIALLLVVAVAVIAAYKLNGPGETVVMRFERADAPATNATVLSFDAVHKQQKDSFLEDHLDTTLQHGASLETDPIRVDRMRQSLAAITGSAGPEWVVQWSGVTLVVTLSSG